jgi:hypothetical protein
MLNAKPTNAETNCNATVEEGKEEDHVKDGETSLKSI